MTIPPHRLGMEEGVEPTLKMLRRPLYPHPIGLESLHVSHLQMLYQSQSTDERGIGMNLGDGPQAQRETIGENTHIAVEGPPRAGQPGLLTSCYLEGSSR